jgi:hypothetical protein
LNISKKIGMKKEVEEENKVKMERSGEDELWCDR